VYSVSQVQNKAREDARVLESDNHEWLGNYQIKSPDSCNTWAVTQQFVDDILSVHLTHFTATQLSDIFSPPMPSNMHASLKEAPRGWMCGAQTQGSLTYLWTSVQQVVPVGLPGSESFRGEGLRGISLGSSNSTIHYNFLSSLSIGTNYIKEAWQDRWPPEAVSKSVLFEDHWKEHQVLNSLSLMALALCVRLSASE
jgi:hypothetical protein